jgi:hypothetical protein
LSAKDSFFREISFRVGDWRLGRCALAVGLVSHKANSQQPTANRQSPTANPKRNFLQKQLK